MSATLPAPARPAVHTGPDPRALSLTAILASGLPPELGTPDAPDLYTVPVVFSRQVSAQERAWIESEETARHVVAEVGTGPPITLVVSDRRLLIGNTNLGLLQDGLAAAIGHMLDRLWRAVVAERDRAIAAAEVSETGERERAAAIASEAAAIRFGETRPGPATGSGAGS